MINDKKSSPTIIADKLSR